MYLIVGLGVGPEGVGEEVLARLLLFVVTVVVATADVTAARVPPPLEPHPGRVSQIGSVDERAPRGRPPQRRLDGRSLLRGLCSVNKLVNLD